ncbi:hypothetical protein [Bradyrhizobium sp.]|jgi:hypothetical protein|uniref:hypothetical protein n=1 Tax=Bradyrhizobium sp. TaxID=376 RepID=UPI003C207A1D
MKDLKIQLEKLLTDVEDCDLIGRLATNAAKREAFKKLAAQLRAAATEIEATIAQRVQAGDA